MEGGRDVGRMWIWKGYSKTDWDAPVMGGTTSAREMDAFQAVGWLSKTLVAKEDGGTGRRSRCDGRT